jgi:hypothetical protein
MKKQVKARTQTLRRKAAKKASKRPVKRRGTVRIYEEDDSILSQIWELPGPCHVQVEIHPRVVRLIVGPRTWEWNRSSGRLAYTNPYHPPEESEPLDGIKTDETIKG